MAIGRESRPVGGPIGRALLIAPSPLNTPLFDAVRAIEAVHVDGPLPPIPLRFNTALGDSHGRFRYVGSEPVSININPSLPHVELATVHEIGHFLDFSGIDAGAFASGTSPLMRPWLDAVRATRRFGELVVAINEAIEGRPDAAHALREVARPEELWARSYAQYVAAQGRSPTLLASIDAFRGEAGTARRLARLLHWDDDDFGPVVAAIEALFRGIGWRSDTWGER